MGPKVLKFCNMMRWRFLKPSSFQKLYKLSTPFFHSPGISLKGLTMLPLSEYACLTTGILLLQRTPVVVSSPIQDRGTVTRLRLTLHLAIPTTRTLALLYLQQLLWLSQGHLVQNKEAGLNSRPPLLCWSRLSSWTLQPDKILNSAVSLCMSSCVTYWIFNFVSKHLYVKSETIPTNIRPKDLQCVVFVDNYLLWLVKKDKAMTETQFIRN